MLTASESRVIGTAKPCPKCKTKDDLIVEITYNGVERTYVGTLFKQQTRGTVSHAVILCDGCQQYVEEPDGTVAVFASVHAAVAAWNERA